MAKYRKKPLVIEAIRNDGAWPPVVAWLTDLAGGRFGGFAFQPGGSPPITRNPDGTLNIVTLEGTMRVALGDWIIRGVAGELYPCKPDIFKATYEPVEAAYDAAVAKHGPMRGPHEGYAVILEEIEELWEAVRRDDLSQALHEAAQVGAMAARFINDLTPIEDLAPAKTPGLYKFCSECGAPAEEEE